MAVREFTESDFPAVCKIYLEAKQDELQFESGRFEIVPLNQDAVILAAFKESTVLVFEEAEVLGFAALYDDQLRAMFVGRGARGRGVGQAMLNCARSRNGEMRLNVAKSNFMAREFYERNGFIAVGEMSSMYGDKAITYVQMKSGYPAVAPRP